MPIPARVVIVPGLAVRSYAKPAVAALRAAGHRASLLRPPAWYGSPYDLAEYGRTLARQLETRGEDVDVLVGLSLGTQAAAIAASNTDRVKHLLLVSPTVDPRNRERLALLRAWASPKDGGGGPGGADEEPGFVQSIPDWAHAGVWRILRGWNSSIVTMPLEEVLPSVSAEVTVVHAEHDRMGTAEWARSLAGLRGGRFIQQAGAPHSWPAGGETDFVNLIGEISR